MMRIFNRSSETRTQTPTPTPAAEQDAAALSRKPSTGSSIPSMSSNEAFGNRASSDASARPRHNGLNSLLTKMHLTSGPQADTSTVSNSPSSQSSQSSLGAAIEAMPSVRATPRPPFSVAQIQQSMPHIPIYSAKPLKEGPLSDAVMALGSKVTQQTNLGPTGGLPESAMPGFKESVAELRAAVSNSGDRNKLVGQLQSALVKARVDVLSATQIRNEFIRDQNFTGSDNRTSIQHFQQSIDQAESKIQGLRMTLKIASRLKTDKPIPLPPDPSGLAAPKAEAQGANPATRPALDKMNSFVGDAVTLHENKIYGQETGTSTGSGMLGALHQNAQEKLDKRLGPNTSTQAPSKPAPASEALDQGHSAERLKFAKSLPGDLGTRFLSTNAAVDDAYSTAKEMYGSDTSRHPPSAKNFISQKLAERGAVLEDIQKHLNNPTGA
jgi:hypothetical protein